MDEDFLNFLEDFVDMLNGVEASIVKMKLQIAKFVGVSEEKQEKPKWDPAKIKWVQVTGASGPYERYPAEGAKPEATEDYKNLLEDLKSHNGKLVRGDYFYWLFSGDQATVGRKPRKRASTFVPSSSRMPSSAKPNTLSA
jgi:hypothetical protein